MISDLLAARLQMAVSLGFHIIFACIGMALPFLMMTSHALWLKTREDHYLVLTKSWTKGLAIFFATGAVSGTALSFELGLLWPEFMKHAGAVIGMPFSWEGTAFFLEAIFMGLFLYGWGRLSERIHWLCGLAIGICGVASAYFVICANAWMNAPTGFDWINDTATNIDPVKAMFNARSFDMALHMILASFVAVGVGVAGIHAWQLLRHPGHKGHIAAVKIALLMASPAAVLMPISGDYTAKQTAKHQPLKLAAMEAHFDTEKGAPLIIGGIPDAERETVDYAIKIPRLLSFLAYGDFNAEVKGLKDFPKDEWPPLLVTHAAFQIMVGLGTLLAGLGAIYLIWFYRKRRAPTDRRVLRLIALLTPAGFVAVEAGWFVTEVGRQPWIIYGIMRTKDAVSPMPGLSFTFIYYCLLYGALVVVVAWLMSRQIKVFNKNPIARGAQNG